MLFGIYFLYSPVTLKIKSSTNFFKFGNLVYATKLNLNFMLSYPITENVFGIENP